METQNGRPEETARTAPPYFAFRTLLNTLEDMRKRGIPARVDRTYLTGMSGAGQTQFLAGMRSLGLIDAAGTVLEPLKAMVAADGEERRRVLANILRNTYPEAVELGEQNATTGQLMEVFKMYGVQGDTARKAIAFYLNAARYTGEIPLSPMFQTPKVTAGTGTKRRKGKVTLGVVSGNGAGQTDESRLPGPPVPDLHPALAGVLIELPRRGRGWTADRRAAFLKMFEMAVDFTIPVSDEEPEEDEFEEAETDETLTA